MKISFKDLFIKEKSSSITLSTFPFTTKGVAVVSASSSNNGVSGYIPLSLSKDFFVHENCITIAKNGSVGSAFFHDYPFICNSDVITLRLKKEYLPENIDLNLFYIYITSLIEIYKKKYSYGHKWNWPLMQNDILEIPFYHKNSKFYIDNEIEKYLNELSNIKINNIKYKVNILEEVNHKIFTLSEVFNIERGKRLITANQIIGQKYFYASSSKFNNGLSEKKIDNEVNVKKFKNVIGINNSGSVGFAFYQEEETIFSDHVTALYPKNPNIEFTRISALYICSLLELLKNKYSFNNEMSNYRLNNEQILLPVDENDQPNWDYMNNIIKYK